MRTRSIYFLISISLIFLTSPAFSVVKAGATCTKVGITKISNGKKYTCTKQGKKLVWDKGVIIKSVTPTTRPTSSPSATPTPSPTYSITPTPTPTPTPTISPATRFFVPWTSELDINFLVDTAEKKFDDWVKENEVPKANHIQVIQPNRNTFRVDYMKSADDFGARIFSRYFVKSSKTIIAANEEWLKLEMSKESWERPQGCDGYGPQGVRYCVNFVGVHAYLVDSEVTYQTENPGADGAALLAHEYFHLVQSNLTGKPGELPSQGFDSQSRNSIPAWLIEGSAEFVGFMVAAKSLKGNYLLGRSAMLNYSPRNYEVSANALKDYEVRIGREGDQTYIYPYHVGQVATEYIVASKGFQALLDIFISYSKTKNFDESFKSALGISKSEFYEKFEQIRTKAGLPPVTWRLDVDVNKKINP